MNARITPTWPPPIHRRAGWIEAPLLARQLDRPEVWVLRNAGHIGQRLGRWVGPTAVQVLAQAATKSKAMGD